MTAPQGCHDRGSSGPTLILVHGWPDSHVVWDGVVPLLADRFRIIRYGNHGAGESGVPTTVSASTMARFAHSAATVFRLLYLGAFSLPVLPPLLVRLSLRRSLKRMLQSRNDIAANRIDHSPDQITGA